MSPNSIASILGGSIFLAALLGCRAKTECEPGAVMPLAVRLRADPRSNLSPQGNPLTTEVRVYQVAGPRTLEESSYHDLLEDAEARLGPDLLAPSLPADYLYPGGEIALSFEREAKARFLAVLAFVREPIGRSWRVITPLPANDLCREGKPVAGTFLYELRGSRLSGGIKLDEPTAERTKRKPRRSSL